MNKVQNPRMLTTIDQGDNGLIATNPAGDEYISFINSETETPEEPSLNPTSENPLDVSENDREARGNLEIQSEKLTIFHEETRENDDISECTQDIDLSLFEHQSIRKLIRSNASFSSISVSKTPIHTGVFIRQTVGSKSRNVSSRIQNLSKSFTVSQGGDTNPQMEIHGISTFPRINPQLALLSVIPEQENVYSLASKTDPDISNPIFTRSIRNRYLDIIFGGNNSEGYQNTIEIAEYIKNIAGDLTSKESFEIIWGQQTEELAEETEPLPPNAGYSETIGSDMTMDSTLAEPISVGRPQTRPTMMKMQPVQSQQSQIIESPINYRRAILKWSFTNILLMLVYIGYKFYDENLTLGDMHTLGGYFGGICFTAIVVFIKSRNTC